MEEYETWITSTAHGFRGAGEGVLGSRSLCSHLSGVGESPCAVGSSGLQYLYIAGSRSPTAQEVVALSLLTMSFALQSSKSGHCVFGCGLHPHHGSAGTCGGWAA